MRASFTVVILAFLSTSLSSCNSDSGTPWRGGPFALTWIDSPDNVWLEYRIPDGGSHRLVEPRVFAVGWDGHYVVAKQHPDGNRSITNFFVIDAARESPRAELSDVVSGPLTRDKFEQLSRELHLPPFSKLLPSLQ
jgi:hypothetical protein